MERNNSSLKKRERHKIEPNTSQPALSFFLVLKNHRLTALGKLSYAGGISFGGSGFSGTSTLPASWCCTSGRDVIEGEGANVIKPGFVDAPAEGPGEATAVDPP
jgi:hypothetical protein